MKKVLKKDGTHEYYNCMKIIHAIKKSADRIGVKLSGEIQDAVVFSVADMTKNMEPVTVADLHKFVEQALDKHSPEVAKSYKDFRNYKQEYGTDLMDDIEGQVKKVLYEVDRENSNSNTRYISTKRTEIAKVFSKELYQKMFIPVWTKQAMREGYIYVHDLSDLILPQFNCNLLDVGNILKGGFELEGVHYAEPKDITTATGQVGDIIMIVSAQHFGGSTTPEIDKILAPYYQKTIEKYIGKYMERFASVASIDYLTDLAKKDAYRDLKQGLQGLEIKLNTVVSARGSYPSK